MPPQIPEFEVFRVLPGKVALITGGAQGIGKATASAFLKAGAKVVICDIQEEKGEEVAKELSALGEILFYKADISVEDEVAKLVQFVVEKFGQLDCAINNAALTPDSTPFEKMDVAYFNKLVGINLTGTALCIKYEMQQFIKQGNGGTIVNLASGAAYKPEPNMPAYVSTKHAIVGLTKQACLEGGPHGIRANALAPGAIYTAMIEDVLKAFGTTEEQFAPQISYLNRFGLPHEVAQAALWLSSPQSSYVTGMTMPIDGGFSVK
ncbi:unnamed protein product [Clonostachys rhizophaga]|uniref:Uncharacterized protein n=1 Tax=Clonostachys rhizophaga TaxID=160324 RepID=A0A9N9YTK2_9HYPO|nr:unnamed protein product [Clonostachys rhizophaga]